MRDAPRPRVVGVALVGAILLGAGLREIGRADTEVVLGGATYPTGSFVIKGDQPYFRLAKILLGTQAFPGEELRTYDDTGWTMGLMHRAEVVGPL